MVHEVGVVRDLMVQDAGEVEHRAGCMGGRASRLRVLAIAAGALGGASLVERFLRAGDALASPSKAQDARILQLVLLLEYTQVAFYEQALREAGLQGELRVFAQTALGHEREHLAAIRKALGPKAGPKPSFDFGRRTRGQTAFLHTAITLEDAAVAAYNGQATNLTAPTLAAAATIVSVEARHAAWVRAIAGDVAAPDPVDQPMTAKQAAAALHEIGLRS
jgi:Ferritin-like domain